MTKEPIHIPDWKQTPKEWNDVLADWLVGEGRRVEKVELDERKLKTAPTARRWIVTMNP